MDEKKILDLTEAVGYVFWEPGACEPINRLIKAARDHWGMLQDRTEVLRYKFVRRLLRRWPDLYTQVPGFEWVTNYLASVEKARRRDPKLDRALWETDRISWGEEHKGPPWDKGRDLERALWVRGKPIIVSQKTRDLRKAPRAGRTEAVRLLAEVTESKDERPIWRSLKKIDDHFSERARKLARVLEEAGYKPQPTEKEPTKKTTPKGTQKAGFTKDEA